MFRFLKKTKVNGNICSTTIYLTLMLFLLISTGVSSCKSNESQMNIVGGVPVLEGYDNVVKIVMLSDRQDIIVGLNTCTATIISDNTLLTAAHCVSDESISKVMVRIKIGNEYPVTDVFKINPRYNNGSRIDDNKHDMAVVVFKTDVFASRSKGVISETLPQNGTEVRLVGYGAYSDGEFALGPFRFHTSYNDSIKAYKRTGTNTTHSDIQCPSKMLEITRSGEQIDRNIDKKRDINDVKDVSVAIGDSGGPMFQEGTNKIYGVVSTVNNFIRDLSTSCFSVPLYESNLKFLQYVADPKNNIGAVIPGIEKLTPQLKD